MVKIEGKSSNVFLKTHRIPDIRQVEFSLKTICILKPTSMIFFNSLGFVSKYYSITTKYSMIELQVSIRGTFNGVFRRSNT